MPDTSLGYTYPASTDHDRIWEHFEELATDINNDVAAIAAKPIGRLVASGTQSIPDNVATALMFTTEDIDTHGFHDTTTNTSRVTPNVPGYYRFYGCYFSGAITTPSTRAAYFRKNGTTAIAPGPRDVGYTISSSKECTALIAMNGTTDYIELMGLQDSAGAVVTNQSVQFSSTLEWEYVRPL